ncbi:unnamed protein product [Effrenium voratum]|nr:unnamed protein product [Effrenium voratum]
MASVVLSAKENALWRYFVERYKDGELFESKVYKKDRVDGIPTFRFDAPDGPVQVWQHAFNLEDVCDQNGGTLRSARSSLVLYHYTNGLCFKNVGNVRPPAASRQLNSLPPW